MLYTLFLCIFSSQLERWYWKTELITGIHCTNGLWHLKWSTFFSLFQPCFIGCDTRNMIVHISKYLGWSQTYCHFYIPICFLSPEKTTWTSAATTTTTRAWSMIKLNKHLILVDFFVFFAVLKRVSEVECCNQFSSYSNDNNLKLWISISIQSTHTLTCHAQLKNSFFKITFNVYNNNNN